MIKYFPEGVFIGTVEYGRGVFAARDYEAGEEILLLWGTLIHWKDLLERGEHSANGLQISNEWYLDLEEPSALLNHSCDPNCGIRSYIHLIALRPIKSGEHLTFDYSLSMDDAASSEEVWTMECQCGYGKCRKVIADFHTLPEEIRQQSLRQGIVQSFIRDKYAL